MFLFHRPYDCLLSLENVSKCFKICFFAKKVGKYLNRKKHCFISLLVNLEAINLEVKIASRTEGRKQYNKSLLFNSFLLMRSTLDS